MLKPQVPHRRKPTRNGGNPFLLKGLALAFTFLCLLVGGSARALPEITDNINEGHSNPISTVRLGDSLYFVAHNTGGAGFRVYQFDLGTGLVLPTPGLPAVGQASLSALGTQIICDAEVLGGNGEGTLWSLDGSGATAFLDVPDGIYPASFIELNGFILFAFSDGVNGYELWVSDGTSGGTEQLLDLHPTGSSSPVVRTVWNGEAYFTATDGVYGYELWKTDGTPGGTVLVKDISPGQFDTSVLSLTVFDDELLIFGANDELYRSDGTAAGTWSVSPIGVASSNAGFIIGGGWAFYSGSDPATGSELYRTDGVIVELLADIVPGPESSLPVSLTRVGIEFYFCTALHDEQLWKSDGTTAGTVLVADLGSTDPDNFSLGNLIEHDGALYFTASTPGDVFEKEVWRSEGTTASTVELEVFPGEEGCSPRYLISGNDHLYFVAFDGTDTGREMWRVGNSSSPELAFEIISERGSHPEVVIGITFLFRSTARIAIGLLALQMVGTFMPLFLLPEVTFQEGLIPYGPTMEGQYIIKNLMIISAALVVGGTVRTRQD